ncbi:MAG: cache domain-containing protein [Gammaproteobacteria bacterium]
MKYLMTGALLCCTLAAASVACAAAEPTEKDAVAMVERGAAFTKAHGKDALIKKITAKDPDFVQGSMYIYVREYPSGTNIAHPFNQAIIGKDLNDVPDTNGKFYRRDIMEMAKKEGKGWVDYMYKNPETGKVEAKTSYLLRVGDVVLVAGVYKK